MTDRTIIDRITRVDFIDNPNGPGPAVKLRVMVFKQPTRELVIPLSDQNAATLTNIAEKIAEGTDQARGHGPDEKAGPDLRKRPLHPDRMDLMTHPDLMDPVLRVHDHSEEFLPEGRTARILITPKTRDALITLLSTGGSPGAAPTRTITSTAATSQFGPAKLYHQLVTEYNHYCDQHDIHNTASSSHLGFDIYVRTRLFELSGDKA